MTFERSPSGQANRSIFYNVDWIIYTEGGSQDQDRVRSYDAIFWSGAFRSMYPDKTFRAIPKGGKDQLRPLALQVVQDGVQKVIVAMDRDYDDIFGQLIIHDRVLYTLGYSFENDIFDAAVLEEVFRSFCPEADHGDDVTTMLDDWTSQFLAAWRWPVRADVFAVRNGVCGFDRERPQKYFESNAYGAHPAVNRGRVAAEVVRMCGECRDRRLPGVARAPVTGSTLIGHIWEVFAFRALTALQCMKSRGPKVAYEHLRALAISVFQVRLLRNSASDELAKFYRDTISRALVSA